MIPLHKTDNESQFGGKATQLGVALRAGLPVPQGFALPVPLVQAVRAGDAAAVQTVREAFWALGGPVAVRSSAVGEDGAAASFAGQHLTRLNVRSMDAAVDAVCAVAASGETEAVRAYLARRGLRAEVRMAVIFQRMVESRVAGVLFTRCPMTGRDERLIEATWGLGEAVVAGLVTPDRYRIDRRGAVLERFPGTKDLKVSMSKAEGTEQVPVDGASVTALCLDAAALAALHDLATRCEEVFGPGRDIEWAFEDKSLLLLQCRAITT
jgi:pyruvate,water dikinase